MVSRAGRRAPAPGVAYVVRIDRVVLDGVPAVDHDHLTAAIQASVLEALAAGAAPLPPSRHVAAAASDAVVPDGSSFVSGIAGAVAPVVVGAGP